MEMNQPFLSLSSTWLRTLNPNEFSRPDQILDLLNFFYLNFISLLRTGKGLADTFLANRYDYYYYSRILIVTFGALIPVVAYKIGKESPVNYSIPAALVFAFFPIYVGYSHFVTPDIPITLFSLIIILFSIRYIRKMEAKYLYLATIFASVNTAEKYPGLISLGIVFFVMVWVQIRRNRNDIWRIIKSSLLEGLKIIGLYILALYIIAPNLFIQYGKIIEAFTADANEIVHPGADGLGWFGNLTFYITDFLNYSNIIIIMFAILGLVGIVRTKDFSILPGFYGLVYWICISKLGLHWQRWGLPMYTFPLLLSAFGFGYLWGILKSKQTIRGIIAIVFGLSMVWSLLFSLSVSIGRTYTDTIVAALGYYNEVGITQENSIYDGYSPFSPGNFLLFDQSKINNSTKYIILSSAVYSRYYNEPSRFKDQINQYETIKKEYTLIKEFTPTSPGSSIRLISWVDDLIYYIQRHMGKYPPERFIGPTILIYRIGN
jgi:hypothetical protein